MHTLYDEHRAVDIVYLDFQKAFDTVPHKRLMKKVRALGIRGQIANWIENWLSNRQQRVVINGEYSGWSTVTSGVPQGSVLGPLLFLIYINDIDVGTVSTLSKFADDIKIGANVSTQEGIDGLQADLNRFSDWAKTWQMSYNIRKYKTLHVGKHNPKIDYQMIGQTLDTTHREKDVGVHVSDDLQSTTHCVEIEKICHRILSYIKRHFSYLDKDIVLPLYNALVRSRL